jgi:hypothetical protein
MTRANIAERMATESVEPIKQSVIKVLKRAALPYGRTGRWLAAWTAQINLCPARKLEPAVEELPSVVMIAGQHYECRQMWFYVQMWFPLLAIVLTAAICLSVVSFIMGQAKPQP